ncbi:MAG: ABC transporter permease [Verrucomicrobiota bacterium JB024]|nr:ABC transporter permease [Verrucomicrobiota bacterium JB024]
MKPLRSIKVSPVHDGPLKPGRLDRREWALTLPTIIWLVLLFAVPTALVFLIALRPANPAGGIGEGWTLATLKDLMQPAYPAIIWRTVWLSVVATAICLGLALPVAYYLARLSRRSRQWVLLLVILPFWSNFLIRIFAWRTVLHPDGWLKQGLVFLRLMPEDATLLYNSGAILLVLVYTYLPFAILPLYAAAEKFDFALLEAARDLGAKRFRAWCTVFLPGVSRGLLTALLVVLIPALGSYAIPDLVGGPGSEMIGNKIAQRVFSDRNLPHAAGLSALLAMAVMVPVIVMLLARRDESKGGGRP